jgi:hypothetical protein
MDELASRQYPVQEHMAFQRRMWIVQRIGWAMMGVISLAALFGLFGYGVLSKRTATGAEMSVQYERFERATRRASFVFRFAASANTERRLHLNRAFQEGFEISSIQPPPLRSSVDADGIDLSFAVTPSVTSQIVIWARPHRYGTVGIAARVDDTPPVDLRVFIYP